MGGARLWTGLLSGKRLPTGRFLCGAVPAAAAGVALAVLAAAILLALAVTIAAVVAHAAPAVPAAAACVALADLAAAAASLRMVLQEPAQWESSDTIAGHFRKRRLGP